MLRKISEVSECDPCSTEPHYQMVKQIAGLQVVVFITSDLKTWLYYNGHTKLLYNVIIQRGYIQRGY